ncbi:MAG TPA: UDP-2,4-diacetamido-2,4,6-trideoxy-beta-L-altropyranose hydrolase [Candidatus Nanoarchaeia archaeon]|nr:UDP-2,4-diacetamido-2,4,6-trideoxy-beta-L-altropyranose hydrolase [Candidatus Nanoarchaeia archaeon]
MKVAAIIQARTGSTRLPKKVLLDISGKPMLVHVIDRVKMAKKVDEIIIATTTNKKDDVVVNIAKKEEVNFFRGSEEDVLDRYYNAAKQSRADLIVRITSDCTLIDPEIIDRIIGKFQNVFENKKADYASNVHERTFPRGLDVEVFSFKALEKSFKEAKDPVYREHVTAYIYRHPEIFKICSLKASNEYFAPELRFCVDTKEDLALIRKIYEKLYKKGFVETRKAIWLVKKDKLYKINEMIEQKAHQSIKQKILHKKIFFRLDYSRKIGVGHLMRCLALAEKINAESIFLLQKTSPEIIGLIKSKGFGIVEINFNNEIEELNKIKKLVAVEKPFTLIIDLYNRSQDYFNELRKIPSKLVVIDDFAGIRLDADIIISNNFFANNLNYNNFRGNILLGPKYAFLRKEFENFEERKITKDVKNLLIMFGGADNKNLTTKTLKILRNNGRNKIVVVGKIFSKIAELKKELKHHKKFELYVDAINISELMKKSDIAISAAGTTMFELAATGTPTLAVAQVEHQKIVAEACEKAGFAINLGDDEHFQNYLLKYLDELSSSEIRKKLSVSGQKLVDGKGAERVADEIMRLA